MTRLSSMWKKKVWFGSSGSCGWRRCASFQVMTSPVYSMIRLPAAIGLSANTPLPWTPERRTWMRPRGLGAAAVSDLVLGLFLPFVFFGYIEFMGARAWACAREARIVWMRQGRESTEQKTNRIE